MKEWAATNYAVVYSPDLKHLVKEVQKWIREGWKPQGGIASTDTGSHRLIPACIKRWLDFKMSHHPLLDFPQRTLLILIRARAGATSRFNSLGGDPYGRCG